LRPGWEEFAAIVTQIYADVNNGSVRAPPPPDFHAGFGQDALDVLVDGVRTLTFKMIAISGLAFPWAIQ
jgi:hypothetical protein